MGIGMRWLYRTWYRWGTPPWVMGPREELVRLLAEDIVPVGRALDLGCGTGANAIHLAEHGYETTGIDYADSAIDRARESAAEAGVDVRFVVGDVTDMPEVEGPFDLVVDYGTFDDLPDAQRPAAVQEILRVTEPGSRVLLWCFEKDRDRWAPLWRTVFGGEGSLRPGEAEASFAPWFDVECIGRGETDHPLMPHWAAYLLQRTHDRDGVHR